MKLLVTGGAGFVGSHLVDRLIEGGHSVAVIDSLITGKRQNVNKKARLYKADIRDKKKMEKIFFEERPKAVFHFAAHIEARLSLLDPVQDAEANILGTIQILEQCKESKVKRVLFASSGGEIYGFPDSIPVSEEQAPNPLSPYGIAKLSAEHYLSAYQWLYGIQATALRFGNIYGPRQNPHGEAGVVGIFANLLLKGKSPVIHGNGEQTKDYVYVTDAVEATVLAFKKELQGVVNIGTGKETSVNEIFRKLREVTGSTKEAKHKPLPAITTKRFVLSIEKARKELGWEPQYSLEQGLRETVKWLKSDR